MAKKKIYLSVTGTMGSGKTTAARLLSKHLKFHLIEENFGENAFLPRFYKDMQRWAFHSQTFFLMEKISQTLQTNVILKIPPSVNNKKVGGGREDPIRITKNVGDSLRALRLARNDKLRGIIQDTPIYQDVFSYAKAQHIMGQMDDAEWRLYQKIYRSFEPHLPKPDYIVYLKTDLENIKKRIGGRNRSFEQKIPDGYLELLEMLNEAWMKKENNGIKVITIETDELNLVRSKKDIEHFLKQVTLNLKLS